jgi:soluble lytic murein transglycosylase-like protein
MLFCVTFTLILVEDLMSIKISATGRPPVPPQRPSPVKADGDRATFATELQLLLQPPEKTAATARQACLQAKLLALSMSRNLLSESDDAAAESFPALPPALFPTAIAGPLPGQNFDNGQPAPTKPPPLKDIIERAAAAHGVDAKLVRAVIRTESGDNPAAVSPVGAQGLMQLMPATSRELGVTNPFDPEQNVMAGTRYLRRLLDRYDGDLDRTLAAYNWGMGNVERQGMERLPQETRNYLARVKSAKSLV